MDTLVRVILIAVYLLALRLGIKMTFKKAGRGSVISTKGFAVWRTFILSVLATVSFWWIVLPSSVPWFFSVGLPDYAKGLGLIFFTLGWVLRVWSQMTMGSAWSADISSGGRLVTSGPYSWVRHPMYTSYFVIAPTLLAATDNWLIGSLAFSYALVSLARVSKEEEELLKIFEAQYAEYRQSVPGAICPKIFSKD